MFHLNPIRTAYIGQLRWKNSQDLLFTVFLEYSFFILYSNTSVTCVSATSSAFKKRLPHWKEKKQKNSLTPTNICLLFLL